MTTDLRSTSFTNCEPFPVPPPAAAVACFVSISFRCVIEIDLTGDRFSSDDLREKKFCSLALKGLVPLPLPLHVAVPIIPPAPLVDFVFLLLPLPLFGDGLSTVFDACADTSFPVLRWHGVVDDDDGQSPTLVVCVCSIESLGLIGLAAYDRSDDAIDAEESDARRHPTRSDLTVVAGCDHDELIVGGRVADAAAVGKWCSGIPSICADCITSCQLMCVGSAIVSTSSLSSIDIIASSSSVSVIEEHDDKNG